MTDDKPKSNPDSPVGADMEKFDAILKKIDELPELENACDPLEWDEFRLPK